MIKLGFCILALALSGCKTSGIQSSKTYDAGKATEGSLVGKMFTYDYEPVPGLILSSESVIFKDGSNMVWSRPAGFGADVVTDGTYEIVGGLVKCKFKEDPYGWQLREFKVLDKDSLKLSRKQRQENGQWVDFPTTGNDIFDFPAFKLKQAKVASLAGKRFVYKFEPVPGQIMSMESVTFKDGKSMVWSRPVGLSGNLETDGSYEVSNDRVICRFEEDPYGWQIRELKVLDEKELKLIRKQKVEQGKWVDYPSTGNDDFDFPVFLSK